MKDRNPFTEFFSQNDLTKFFGTYPQASPFDMKAFLETQRKNMQAMTEAQQAAIEGFRNLAQRQSEIFSQLLEDNSTLAKGMMAEGTPEEKVAKNARLFKTAYERTVKSMRELSEMAAQTNIEASNVINKRVAATMNEIQSSVEKDKDRKEAA
jgi:phasin family protein